MPRKLDWKRELDKKELKYGVLFLLLYFASILIVTSGCSRPSSVQAAHAARGGKATLANAKTTDSVGPVSERSARIFSGRQLTIEKHAQRKETLHHFDDDVYGVSFDFPKSYDLHEGELPDMDRGLGYLGKIPMEFSAPGGVRLATVEIPRGANPGTDFVNAFLTVSVLPNTTASQCAEFQSIEDDESPSQIRKIDGIAFRAKTESAAASMHQYSGTYLHGYAEESCYEIGYGIATAGYGAMDGIKKVNNQAVLKKLEKILDLLTIHPPQIEDTSAVSAGQTQSQNRN